MKYSIVIPCYNEESNVRGLVQQLKSLPHPYDIEWVLVDNGSRDQTRTILQEICRQEENFKLVCVDKNVGYGFGLQQGMHAATGDYIGWLHADMQVAPEYMIRFMDYMEKNPGKKLFLKGKRENRNAVDKFFTAAMTLFATALFGTYLHDIGAIPVLFRRELLAHLVQMPYDFSIETYVYLVARRQGYTVKRFPVDMSARKGGVSSWDKGFSSKIRQSCVIIGDLLLIKRGKQVK